MRTCVVTATMGNYARLRYLWLKDEVAKAANVWKDFTLDRLGFTNPKEWGSQRILVHNGEAIVAATPSEADPAKASYAKDVPPEWRYVGQPATQYWRTAPDSSLAMRVNGRIHYWATMAFIPGGISYENFELVAPFRSGREFIFGVTPEAPEELGFPVALRKQLTDGK
jgi:hypothetical protein